MKKTFAYINTCVYVYGIITKIYIMRTELLNIYEIAQRVASIAEGETRKSLAIEIARLTICLQTNEPVYILYNNTKKFIYITMSKRETDNEIREGYKLIIIIERSKELNKYKIKTYE
jgi:hypothetical protein